MKSTQILGAAAALLAVLAVGNPGTDSYATHELKRLERGGGVTAMVSGTLPGATRAYLLDNTTRSNYGLFSIYRLQRPAQDDEVTLGVLWSFIRLHGAARKQE